MLATLIPLFDADLAVKAYSIFARKENYFLHPKYSGFSKLDGANYVIGLDLIDVMGMETISGDLDIFVPLTEISLFSDLNEQCGAPPEKLVLLIDRAIVPCDNHIERIKELKAAGYRFAIRRLMGADFENYKAIISEMDYIFINPKKLQISRADEFFRKTYPGIKICVVGIKSMEEYEEIAKEGRYDLYEGSFFRLPITRGKKEAMAPLKTTYIELLNVVNERDYDLTKAADVIERDTAIVVSLLNMVNRMTVVSGINSVQHAVAMLGQKELKRWIVTAITRELCADRPSEIMRLSLIRAKFAENLSKLFGFKNEEKELFLMGLFSVLDKILDRTIEEALQEVKVSKEIYDALVSGEGPYAELFQFMKDYEEAYWPEVSRVMLLKEIEVADVYEAYKGALNWYRLLL
ncbi:EAL and HDOD domain-containing protein [Eubacterium oxidoreducens]|uniref:EAL and modified HD-GYP domain-containing signal transduction protein n=1 Tax=Eubacterium oxidoreducens TaxID=1732 RepID=A0A1G6AAU4_EUBOX|nr:HDOD domain-containing protein [Eubacterium oxidoreducens]SDB05436.1 EAL and modified HD-GYP domain-containing signal transduction protein [Eubacterium oxidoreducens]